MPCAQCMPVSSCTPSQRLHAGWLCEAELQDDFEIEELSCEDSSQHLEWKASQRLGCYMLQAFQHPATAEQPPAQHQQHAPVVQHSGGTQVLPQLWGALAKKYGDQVAVHDPHQQPETRLTYRQGLVRPDVRVG